MYSDATNMNEIGIQENSEQKGSSLNEKKPISSLNYVGQHNDEALKESRNRRESSTDSDHDGRKHSRKRRKHESKKDKRKKHRKHKSRKEYHRSRSKSESSESSSSWSSSDSSLESSSSTRKKHKKAKSKKSHKNSHKDYAESNAANIPLESSTLSGQMSHDPNEEDDDIYGPIAPVQRTSANINVNTKGYGHHLLAGEGEAIAAFVQQNERIPRRGEVGYDGEQIEKLENLGYVMSGSRHTRMEAVRKRKENQIISAEEKRLLIINETQKKLEKEAKVLEEMRHLIKKKEYQEASASNKS